MRKSRVRGPFLLGFTPAGLGVTVPAGVERVGKHLAKLYTMSSP